MTREFEVATGAYTRSLAIFRDHSRRLCLIFVFWLLMVALVPWVTFLLVNAMLGGTNREHAIAVVCTTMIAISAISCRLAIVKLSGQIEKSEKKDN